MKLKCNIDVYIKNMNIVSAFILGKLLIILVFLRVVMIFVCSQGKQTFSFCVSSDIRCFLPFYHLLVVF